MANEEELHGLQDEYLAAEAETNRVRAKYISMEDGMLNQPTRNPKNLLTKQAFMRGKVA